MFILLIFFGHDQTWAVTIFTIALTLNGAVTAGYLGNGLDIAPNFSGTIFGMANTLSSFGGFVSAWMVGQLTEDNVRSKFFSRKAVLHHFSIILEHIRSMANHFRNCGSDLSDRKSLILVYGKRRAPAMEQPARKERSANARLESGRGSSIKEKQCIIIKLVVDALEKFISIDS